VVSINIGQQSLTGFNDTPARGAGSSPRPETTPVTQAPQIWAMRGLQIALWALVCFLLARTLWLIIAPLNAPNTPPIITSAAKSSIEQSLSTSPAAQNPFALAKIDFHETKEQTITRTTLDLSVHGIRLDGDTATAIIAMKQDNKGRVQHVFSPGQTIDDGILLDEIRPHEVIISRNGIREAIRLDKDTLTLDITNQNQANDDAQNAFASNRSEQSLNRFALSGGLQKFIQLRLRNIDINQPALFLFPGEDKELFAKAGLVAQDQLISLNGSPPPLNLRQLYQKIESISLRGNIAMVVERDGITKRINFNLDDLLSNSKTLNDAPSISADIDDFDLQKQ